MTIKHFIMTRFLTTPIGLTEEEIQSDVVINYRLNLLKNNLAKSLYNQTNKNFTFVLILNDKLPEIKSNKIKDFCIKNLQFNTKFITSSEIQHFVEINYKLCDKLILTRIDDDDFCYKNAVNDVQQICKNVNDICVHGYTKGYTSFYNTKELFEFEHDYDGNGHLSIFQSLIIDTKCKYHKFFNCYGFQHTKVKEYLEKLQKLGYKTNMIQDKENHAFVYIRHNHTSSLKDFKLPRFCAVQKLDFNSLSKNLKDNFNLSYDLK